MTSSHKESVNALIKEDSLEDSNPGKKKQKQKQSSRVRFTRFYNIDMMFHSKPNSSEIITRDKIINRVQSDSRSYLHQHHGQWQRKRR